MNVGLYFGSFNPVHNAHIRIGEYMHSHYPMDEIWYVLSPQNPLKEEKDLLHASQRLQLLETAIKDFSYMKVSTIEFDLPKPSYTYVTLRTLRQQYPNSVFSIIMGNDSMKDINQWKNYQEISDGYMIYLYPRNDIELFIVSKHIIQTNAPKMNVSSSEIRAKIKAGESIKELVPSDVFKIIQSEQFYV
ncbi:MAG: nicotinate (nicotinamide) nucleotide adenylyltransferase [Bacteroidales bacterium]|nr:nicotinate (nicotinamide) nucleotide adenylyltransferase [Bacteroidales bacterium]MDY0015248.1 nicotinate (nicotinamide) nucleotide adenylyltransferase [Bacteroidales bacterium]